MLRRFRVPFLVLLALCLLLLSSRQGLAQNDIRTITPWVPPAPSYPSYNGYTLPFYYSSPSAGLPTYMTSIYYPRIYGAFEYPRPLGIYQPSLQRGPYTTSPGLYSVYTTPPSAFGPGENVLSSAMTPQQTTAFVTVWVPADAELRFEGIRTDQRGAFRRFITPPLIPGREYTYDINATWTESGQPVTKTRHLPVRAGERLYVDFRVPEATEGGTRTLQARPLPEQPK